LCTTSNKNEEKRVYTIYINFIYLLDNIKNILKIRYRFAEMIEKSLNIVFLCEMVGCTIIICFLEFGVLKVFLFLRYF